MNSLILNSFDARGGAAIATFRIDRALRRFGVSTQLVVASKDSDDTTVAGRTGWTGDGITKLLTCLDSLPVRCYRERQFGPFSPAWVPDNLSGLLEKYNPDVLHLFWVTAGFLRIESLRKVTRPIVWTLHDMWPFTGGCHYDNECGKYAATCGQCPALNSKHEWDLSRHVWKRKAAAWAGLPITLVATSKWLFDCAKSSSLFKHHRIELIPNCVDTDKYKSINRSAARQLFGLSQSKAILLFSAGNADKDRRKGLHLLIDALRLIASRGWADKVEVVLLGVSVSASITTLPFTVHRIPILRDEYSQVALYSAADVLVAPSLQENLSNVVVESLACGTPVVAFNIGGMPDLISHNQSGYLAKPFDPDDLAMGIESILGLEGRRGSMSSFCRVSALRYFSQEEVARQYAALYADLVTCSNIQ